MAKLHHGGHPLQLIGSQHRRQEVLLLPQLRASPGTRGHVTTLHYVTFAFVMYLLKLNSAEVLNCPANGRDQRWKKPAQASSSLLPNQGAVWDPQESLGTAPKACNNQDDKTGVSEWQPLQVF